MVKQIFYETPDRVLDNTTVVALKEVNTSAFVDVLARNGYDARHVLMDNIIPLSKGKRLVARAITVRYLPARPDADLEKPDGEKSPEYAAFEIAGPGDVIVMEAMGTKLMSIGGDIKFLRLKQRKIDGLICDGGVRDMKSVNKYGVRIWGYGRTSNLGTKMGTPYSTNDPVRVDGILVKPGDYIVADDDGVVVIPMGIAPLIARQALEYTELESWIKKKLAEENLSPGKYYPPDEKTFEEFRNSK